MANAGERHEQLMQQMAALTASLGGLTNLNPLLAQQQQTNAELSSLSTHLGGVAARIDALVAAGGVPPPSGVAGTAAAGGVTPTVPLWSRFGFFCFRLRLGDVIAFAVTSSRAWQPASSLTTHR